jgi:hypothetical protein
MRSSILHLIALVLFFFAPYTSAQTISALNARGFYGRAIGAIPNQTVLSVGTVQEVVVRDATGQPAANVRVRFASVVRDWMVLFNGNTSYDTVTDSGGIARALATTPVVNETALQVDRYGTSYGSANILVSLIESPSIFAYLRGAMDVNEPWYTSYGGFTPIPSARITLEVVAPNVVRVTSDSRTPLRGVDLLDGEKIITRIPSLLGSIEISIPRGISSLTADYGGGWEYRSAGSNALSRQDLEFLPKSVPINETRAWLIFMLAIVGVVAQLRRGRG